jgi:hypothetical protein
MVDGKEVLQISLLYALRRYAMSYVRPTGPLPLLRVDKQPYALLPLVGKRFADPGDSEIETALNKVMGVLRPMWELASKDVPLMKDGNVEKAKDILQTAPWSQAAFYRDKDVKAMCMAPSPFSDAQGSGRNHLIQNILSALGPFNYWDVHVGYCNDFLPDGTQLVAPNNYLDDIAKAAIQTPAAGKATLDRNQAGPALLQALAAYSVQKEQGDAVDRFASASSALNRVLSRATSTMPYVETVLENEAMFTVQTPKELASVSIPAITGRATLGEHVANTVSAQL